MTTQSKGYQFSAADAADLTALRTVYDVRDAAGQDAVKNPLAKQFLEAAQQFKADISTKISALHCASDTRAAYYRLTQEFAKGAKIIGNGDRATDMPLLMAELELVREHASLEKSFRALIDSGNAYIRSVQSPIVVVGMYATLPVYIR